MSDPDAQEGLSPSRQETRAETLRATDLEFSSFYRSAIHSLVAFLINQGARICVAGDIAQDTMTKAYQHWPEIDNPPAWVRTVASRALVRHCTETREEALDPVPEPTALLPRPEEAAAWEARQDIVQALRTLPPRQRQVMAWTLSGYTPAEIAEELGISPNAVSASLKKARRATIAHLARAEEDRDARPGSE
ncbi:sigma-70 family RNA polymerase sigma factor [Nonomuraea sp. NPDC049419]|uniref:sigma-70 family RNA polymerase sigma factor n=1 Tax=Nonomuraea sp. NPDC049419 TaxID=3155772 RepID=UPI003412C0E9